jgi:hypothetical protein
VGAALGVYVGKCDGGRVGEGVGGTEGFEVG